MGIPANDPEVRDAVVDALRRRACNANRLIDCLAAETGYDADAVSNALWWLLDNRQIRVTPDRKIITEEDNDAVPED